MGVVLPPLPERRSPPRPTPILLCPARFVPVKGHTYLLEAAARLKSRGVGFELWLAGDGPEGQAIRKRIDTLGLSDSVRLLGIVPHAELLRFYREQEVDCVVLPSLDLGGGVHEGISVALMEAMAYGVPTVATSTGGLPELLGERAGLLVPPADAEALADALERILGSGVLRCELARAGRRRVAEEFEVGAITRQLVQHFDGMPPGNRPQERHSYSPPERRVAGPADTLN
jgi:colanic acid/amylovoran biosynthesis glycosyltransferase